ncbi:unnamed protein product [Amoebophrya sp. A25]|nr:unnamed protein product [Amoebophrya sp. A25]|eukprot:GSA25T00021498001.1
MSEYTFWRRWPFITRTKKRQDLERWMKNCDHGEMFEDPFLRTAPRAQPKRSVGAAAPAYARSTLKSKIAFFSALDTDQQDQMRARFISSRHRAADEIGCVADRHAHQAVSYVIMDEIIF